MYDYISTPSYFGSEFSGSGTIGWPGGSIVISGGGGQGYPTSPYPGYPYPQQYPQQVNNGLMWVLVIGLALLVIAKM